MPIPEGSESHSEESGFTNYPKSDGASSESYDQPEELAGSGSCHISDANQMDLSKVTMTGACELSG